MDAGQSAFGTASSIRSFVLSPHTEATLTVQPDCQLSVNGFVWQPQPAGEPVYLQSAASGIQVQLYGFTSDGSFSQLVNYQTASGVQSNESSAARSGTAPQAFTFVNQADAPITYSLQTTLIMSSSETGALPVPEPASYALLLAGLALVGRATRRKRN